MDPKESVLSDKKEANPIQRSRSPTNDGESSSHLNPPPSAGSQRRSAEPGIGPDGRPRRPTNFDEPLEQWERDEFEVLLEGVKGHLGECSIAFTRERRLYYSPSVVFPTRFLEGEDTANNFLFNSDRCVLVSASMLGHLLTLTWQTFTYAHFQLVCYILTLICDVVMYM